MASVDEEKRKAQRKQKADVAAGVGVSTADMERDAARETRTDDPYAQFVGVWVLIQGVREHYRGRLQSYHYFPGGCRLVFDTLYHLANFDEKSPSLDEGEMKLPSPQILQESATLMICPQPSAWAKGDTPK